MTLATFPGLFTFPSMTGGIASSVAGPGAGRFLLGVDAVDSAAINVTGDLWVRKPTAGPRRVTLSDGSQYTFDQDQMTLSFAAEPTLAWYFVYLTKDGLVSSTTSPRAGGISEPYLYLGAVFNDNQNDAEAAALADGKDDLAYHTNGLRSFISTASLFLYQGFHEMPEVFSVGSNAPALSTEWAENRGPNYLTDLSVGFTTMVPETASYALIRLGGVMDVASATQIIAGDPDVTNTLDRAFQPGQITFFRQISNANRSLYYSIVGSGSIDKQHISYLGWIDAYVA